MAEETNGTGSSSRNLELEVEQAVRSGFTPVEETEEALQTALENRPIGQLFRKLTSFPPLKRLLFLHHYDLFAVEEDFQLPFFYVSSLSAEDESASGTSSRTLEHVVDNELERSPDGPSEIQDIPFLDTERWEELGEDLADILVYFLIKWLQKNRKVVELARRPSLQYGEMKKALGDTTEALSGQLMPETEEILEGEATDIDPAIEAKIERLFIELVQVFIQLLEGEEQPGAGVIPDVAIALHKSSHIWMRRVRNRSDLGIEDYQAALDELYRLKLITNRDTIFWCEECGLDEPGYTERHGRIAPKHLSESSCLRCGDTHSYGAVYQLSDEFKQTLLAKDGLLAVYFGWLLEDADADYQLSETPGSREVDYLVEENAVVEVKMVKGGRDDQGTKSQLDGAMSQLNKQVANLRESGESVEQAFLIWNQWEWNKDWPERLLRKYEDLDNLEAFRVVGPHQVEALVDHLNS